MQVYRDDILIFSMTREEHLVHVSMVIETLRHHKMYAEATKCHFGRSSVGFLSHVISERLTLSRSGQRLRRARTCASFASHTSMILLPQVCLTFLRHCSPANDPLPPPG